MPRRNLSCLAFLLVLPVAPAISQSPIRYGACRTAADADSSWARFSFAGLQLSLRLPAELRAISYGDLRKLAGQVELSAISPGFMESLELVAAWRAPARAPGEIHHVLLYTVRPTLAPSGRPCSLAIAGQPGLVFLQVLNAGGGGAAEYWTEAYWPGYVLAVRGKTMDSYDVAFRMLRSIVPVP